MLPIKQAVTLINLTFALKIEAVKAIKINPTAIQIYNKSRGDIVGL